MPDGRADVISSTGIESCFRGILFNVTIFVLAKSEEQEAHRQGTRMIENDALPFRKQGP